MYKWPRTPYEKAHWRALSEVLAPDDFLHLNVTPLLPKAEEGDSAWIWYVDIVKAKSKYGKGLLGGEWPDAKESKRFSPEEILQICLLHTPPFDFDGTLDSHQDKIRDVRLSPHDPLCDCPGRPQLIQELAKALFEYELWCRALEDGSQALTRDMMQRLKSVEEFVSYYMKSRKERKLPGRSRLHRHEDTIKRMFTDLAKVLETITPQDYLMMDDLSPALYRDNLETTMWNIFLRHGLRKKHGRAYSEDAARHAIAAILLRLGVEDSSLKNEDDARQTVAERIRKRLEA